MVFARTHAALIENIRRNILLTLLTLCALAPAAWATTLHVENWGVDSGTCGTAAAPCRTIGEAVTLAAAGNTILVGPGLYSNALGEPAGGIVLSNPITVKSTHGFAATGIVYAGAFPSGGIVSSTTTAVFGTRNHGFGIIARPSSVPSGNPSVVRFAGGGKVSGNVIDVINSPTSVDGIQAAGGAIVRDNRVSGTPGSVNFGIASDGITERNVVTGTLNSAFAPSNGPVRRNVAIGNGSGFEFGGPTVTEFKKNIAISNSDAGVLFDNGIAPSMIFEKNTFAGNGGNCGVTVYGSNQTLSAAKNFWGAATGPGADPADTVCNNGPFNTITTTPFLTHPVAPGPGALQ